jgi:carboxyl-terminal processing protease
MVKKSNPSKTSVNQSAKLKQNRNGRKTIRSRVETKAYLSQTSEGIDSSVIHKENLIKSAERFRLILLSIFATALVFLFGIGIGNRAGDSVVDNAISNILKNAPKEIDRNSLERAAIEGALKATGDQWANYFPLSTLQTLKNRSANALTGVGITLKKKKTGAIEIAQVLEGSPAEKSGLNPGDLVLEINGTNVQGASVATAVALIRGEIGESVKIIVQRDTTKIAVVLQNERVSLKSVKASQIEKNIAYLKISSFSSGTSSEVSSALSQLRSDGGVILDLRNNPGGLIQEAVNTAKLFVERGNIVSYKLADDEKIYSVSNPNAISVPIVIIINRDTASAAEILAAAFQDRNRGVVIGERSYGKGSVQDFVELNDGSSLEITVALYLTPSGRTIEGVGVTPDLVVKESELSVKAVQILGGLAELGKTKKK